MTLSIMTLSMMTLSIMTLSIMTISIRTLNQSTFSGHPVCYKFYNFVHNCYSVGRYSGSNNTVCCYYAWLCRAKPNLVILSVILQRSIMKSDIVINVIMLNVIMITVVAPLKAAFNIRNWVLIQKPFLVRSSLG
jgi:hypothetical protein